MSATNITVHPIHLGLGATADVEPEFTGGMEWYGAYSARHADGSTDTVTLAAGEYAINPPGTWHTADVTSMATALFITAGEGTDHRPR